MYRGGNAQRRKKGEDGCCRRRRRRLNFALLFSKIHEVWKGRQTDRQTDKLALIAVAGNNFLSSHPMHAE